MRITLSATLLMTLMTAAAVAADWPQFRGAQLGVGTGTPPLQWNVPEKQNVAWQADLPGRGPASPIVVNDRVIVTASGGPNQDLLYVLCFDLHSGKPLWKRQFWATGATACHPQSAVAAPTPASDGKRIFAYYSSNDLICLDLDGNLQWCRGLTYDYPQSRNDVGMSSSPVVVAGIVVVQCENQGDSFAIGIDASTGETRWRIDRDPAASWTSPVASADPQNQSLILLQSGSGVTAIDPQTGRQLWHVDMSCDVIPSPILQKERAFFVGIEGVCALELRGQPETPERKWASSRLRPGAASPIVNGDRIYIVNRAGVLNCADANTGEVQWQLRLKGDFWATPAISGDLMFLLSQDGLGQVVRLGVDAGEVVSQNPIGETLQASPAIVDDSLIVRSDQHLWCLRAAQ